MRMPTRHYLDKSNKFVQSLLILCFDTPEQQHINFGRLGWHYTEEVDPTLIARGIMGASTQAVAGARVEAEDIVSARPPRTVLLVLAFCFCYIAGALALWPATFLEMAPTYFLVLALYGWMIALAIVLPLGVIAAPKQPVRAMIDIIRRRGMLAVFVVATFALGLAAFTTYKLNIPTFVPFYGDKAMADIDDFLHGGPPWKIAHSVDSEMTSWIVSRTYYGTWFFEWFAEWRSLPRSIPGSLCISAISWRWH